MEHGLRLVEGPLRILPAPRTIYDVRHKSAHTCVRQSYTASQQMQKDGRYQRFPLTSSTSACVWAPRTKCHRPGGFSNRHGFLTAPEAGKSEIRAPADSCLGRALLPCLVHRAFRLCSLRVEGDGTRVSSSLWKGIYSLTRAPLAPSPLALTTSQGPRLQIPSRGGGVEASIFEFGEGTFSPYQPSLFVTFCVFHCSSLRL